jgi:hypothetical protein
LRPPRSAPFRRANTRAGRWAHLRCVKYLQVADDLLRPALTGNGFALGDRHTVGDEQRVEPLLRRQVLHQIIQKHIAGEGEQRFPGGEITQLVALRPFRRSRRPRAWLAPGVEQHQDLQLALGGASSGQREIEISFARDHIAIALLQGDHCPPHARQHLPEKDALGVDRPPRLTLVAAIEGRAVSDAASLPVEPCEAPTFATKPADILMRIAPAGKFPIENPGQGGAIEHVIPRAEIMVTEHRLDRRGGVRLKPADAPFEHWPRRRMIFEIGAKSGDLVRWATLFIGSQECEIGARWMDRVDAG